MATIAISLGIKSSDSKNPDFEGVLKELEVNMDNT